MAADVRWLGHSAFHLSGGGADVLIDPFLTGNPKAAATADELPADVILLTHGHGDHLGDTVDIAKRTGATVVAIVELAAEIEGAGVSDVRNPNYGGTVTFDWGWVKLVPAWHPAVSPSGTAHAPAGLLIHYGGHLIYHLGDTCLFSDLQLIARRGDKVDLALVPIGGHFTMDRYDAVTAVEFIQPQQVIPIHYGTFPPVETDAEAFKKDVQTPGFSEVLVLTPGDPHHLKCPTPLSSSKPSARRFRRSAASSPTSPASPRRTRSPASGTSWRSCGCATPRRSRRSSRPGSPRSPGSPVRTPWWPSRSSPSTTWRRCSASVTERADPYNHAPARRSLTPSVAARGTRGDVHAPADRRARRDRRLPARGTRDRDQERHAA